jgi:hypothetical protein
MRDRKFHWFVLLAWMNVATIFIVPTRGLPGLPDNIRLGDLLTLISFSAILILLAHRQQFPKTNPTALIVSFLLYISTILILPLFGIFFLAAPLTYYLGDLRWLEVLVLMSFFSVLYNGGKKEHFQKHLYIFIWTVILFQYPFILSQIAMNVFGLEANGLLELWYPGGEGGYGRYGHHIGRYAGAMINASMLGFVGGIGFMIGGLSLVVSPNLKFVSLFILSTILIVAAGTRTMLFGAPTVLVCVSIMLVVIRGSINRKTLKYATCLLLLLFGVIAILYQFNIGRIASDRYLSIFEWLSGEKSFYEISKRGSKLWQPNLNVAYTQWSSIGTLVNSAHALKDYLGTLGKSTVDSYFVFMLAQGGPIILIPFLCVIFFMCFHGFLILVKGRAIGAVPFAIGIGIFFSSFTQNTMTDLTPRFFMLLGILSIILDNITSKKLRSEVVKRELSLMGNANQTVG